MENEIELTVIDQFKIVNDKLHQVDWDNAPLKEYRSAMEEMYILNLLFNKIDSSIKRENGKSIGKCIP
ncbi:MAG: hypothetical protein DRI65_14210 [Chloroflexota bacterium]|nr:MAG: hypothetical protein DRI65_14210 [Chloroflexota bacterium]